MTNLPIYKQRAKKLSKQAQGTLNKVLEMIEENESCPDVIQQIDSVHGMLSKAREELVAGLLDNCLEQELHKNNNSKEEMLKKLLKVYRLGK